MAQAVSTAFRGSATSRTGDIARTKGKDTLAVLFGVFLPTIAKSVIIRRPAMLALADRFDLDRRAVRPMQPLRTEYGEGPVLINLPCETPPLNGTYEGTAYAQKGLTASGQLVHRHVVAADPDILPIGTRIKIKLAGRYSGEYVVADTGEKIRVVNSRSTCPVPSPVRSLE